MFFLFLWGANFFKLSAVSSFSLQLRQYLKTLLQTLIKNYESNVPAIKAVYAGQNVYKKEMITKLPSLIGRSDKLEVVKHLGITDREFDIIKKLQMAFLIRKLPKHFFLVMAQSKTLLGG